MAIASSQKWYYSVTLVIKVSDVVIMKVELVTSLKRQATKILAELHESKEPVLITEHGQPSAYLVDVEDYEFTQRRLRLLEAITRGEQDILEQRTQSHEDVTSELQNKIARWSE